MLKFCLKTSRENIHVSCLFTDAKTTFVKKQHKIKVKMKNTCAYFVCISNKLTFMHTNFYTVHGLDYKY